MEYMGTFNRRSTHKFIFFLGGSAILATLISPVFLSFFEFKFQSFSARKL